VRAARRRPRPLGTHARGRLHLALIGGVLVFALGLGTLANAGAGWFAAVLWVEV
jgi:hypothetical protein